MNIPPLLEKLLLSNEAVFKNASLGINGANMVFVPQGKTAVILEVSIEPFVNQIIPSFLSFLTQGYRGATGDTIWRQAIQRIHYQLQIINDKYATYINLADSLTIRLDQSWDSTGEGKVKLANGSLHFTGKRESLFIYTDRSIYFNILYPYKINEEGGDTTGLKPTYTNPAAGFLAKIQSLPETPISFNQNTLQDYLVNLELNSAALDHYYSVNHQSSAAFTELPQEEYLRFFAGINETTIQQPVASGTEYEFHDLLTIPFINVKYALLNKRPDDYGIIMPGK